MWHIFPIRCLRVAFIRCWWIGGAFFSPRGITVNFYRPNGVLWFSLYSVLLVSTLIYFSNPSGSLLSQWTFSHHIWQICLLRLTFVPRFTFQTLCPDYLTNPTFLYKYWTRFPVQTTCSYLLNSNKYIVSPLITSPLVHCKDFLGKTPSPWTRARAET